MTAKFSASIERLHEVFRPYRLAPEIKACPCCVTEDDQTRLRSQALRELDYTELDNYAFKAMTTWGDAKTFKHFLPRLFELLATGDGFGYPGALIGKLSDAEWREWPAHEQDAVDAFLNAMWAHAIECIPPVLEPDELIWGIAEAGKEPLPLLDEWLTHDSAAAARHLAFFVGMCESQLARHGEFRDALVPKTARRQVRDWLLSPATARYLEHAAKRFSDAEFINEITTAVNELAAIRAAAKQ